MLVLPQAWEMFGASSRARSALHGLGVAEFQRVLSYGSRGLDVAAVQEQLVRRGYVVGKAGVDGIFARDTQAAVNRFQGDRGMVATGVVNRGVWTELFKTTEVSFGPQTIIGQPPASNVAPTMSFDEVTIFGRTPERQRADRLAVERLTVETPDGSPSVIIERLKKKVPTWAWLVGGLVLGGLVLAIATSGRSKG